MVWEEAGQLWGWYWIIGLQTYSCQVLFWQLQLYIGCVGQSQFAVWDSTDQSLGYAITHSLPTVICFKMLGFILLLTQHTQEGTWYWTLIYKLWAQDRGDYLKWPPAKTEHYISPTYPYTECSYLRTWLEEVWVECTWRDKNATGSLVIYSHGKFPTPPLCLKNRCLHSHLKTQRISHMVLTVSY